MKSIRYNEIHWQLSRFGKVWHSKFFPTHPLVCGGLDLVLRLPRWLSRFLFQSMDWRHSDAELPGGDESLMFLRADTHSDRPRLRVSDLHANATVIVQLARGLGVRWKHPHIIPWYGHHYNKIANKGTMLRKSQTLKKWETKDVNICEIWRYISPQ